MSDPDYIVTHADALPFVPDAVRAEFTPHQVVIDAQLREVAAMVLVPPPRLVPIREGEPKSVVVHPWCLESTIIAGDPTGRHVRLSSDGVRWTGS